MVGSESGRKIEERARGSTREREGARESVRESERESWTVRGDEDGARGNTQREAGLGTRARASESAPYTPPRLVTNARDRDREARGDPPRFHPLVRPLRAVHPLSFNSQHATSRSRATGARARVSRPTRDTRPWTFTPCCRLAGDRDDDRRSRQPGASRRARETSRPCLPSS